jgi:hypothetical protein
MGINSGRRPSSRHRPSVDGFFFGGVDFHFQDHDFSVELFGLFFQLDEFLGDRFHGCLSTGKALDEGVDLILHTATGCCNPRRAVRLPSNSDMSAMASLISRSTVRSCLPSSISLSAMTFSLQGFGGHVGHGASVSPAADLLGPGVIEVGLAHLAVAIVRCHERATLATAHQSLQRAAFQHACWRLSFRIRPLAFLSSPFLFSYVIIAT